MLRFHTGMAALTEVIHNHKAGHYNFTSATTLHKKNISAKKLHTF